MALSRQIRRQTTFSSWIAKSFYHYRSLFKGPNSNTFERPLFQLYQHLDWRVKPYFEDIIDNEYILDIGLGVSIFIIVIFLVLLVNKGISKAVNYTGIGGLDTTFGFFFGFIRAYIISVCIFSGIHIVYNYDKWPINKDQSYIFPYIEKGSNYLIKEFPNEKTYQDSKEKIEEL